MNSDEHWMGIALELARRGEGWVEPNPMVGCVVVRDGVEIASGFHERFGGPHAEVQALRGLTSEELADATLYVTLEPCSHFGKTPPCVDLLLSKPARRVVIAMQDPFEKVSGRGIAKLRQAGLDVTVGVLEGQARSLNAPYLKRLSSRMPWVIAKWAMTLDGAIATATGDSKWISNERSRRQVHRLRSRMDAIIVGSNTVIADDPLLTARLDTGELVPRRATRVVLDRRFRVGPECQLVQTARESRVIFAVDRRWLVEQSDKGRLFRESGVEFLEFEESSSNDKSSYLRWVLEQIAIDGGTNVLVEGGAGVLGSFFDDRLVDQVECYIAPKVLGGAAALRPIGGLGVEGIAQVGKLGEIGWEELDGDLHFSGKYS